MKLILVSVFSFCIALVYGRVYAMNSMIVDWIGMELRPFIYRQIAYQSLRFLNKFMDYESGAMLFIGLSGVLFVWAFVYLLNATHPEFKHKELAALITISLFCVAFISLVQPYDLMTAFLFTLAIATLAHGSGVNYLVVFAISSINRETTFLLIPISLLYGWGAAGWWQLAFMQFFIFVLAQTLIRTVYQNAYGIDFALSPGSNLRAFVEEPLKAYATYIVTFFFLLTIKKQWENQASILKLSFIILIISLTILYFLFGQPFEFRVYAELFPIACALCIPRMVISED